MDKQLLLFSASKATQEPNKGNSSKLIPEEHEVQIGKDDITINHIIPIEKKVPLI